MLLHGFPSGSHQFRRLIDALGAPDYPGFGHSDAPRANTFDALADTIQGFCRALDLDRFAMYVEAPLKPRRRAGPCGRGAGSRAGCAGS